MPDSDFNVIKPVEGLNNITGLTPIDRRQERKRRQNLFTGRKGKNQESPNKPQDKQTPNDASDGDENDRHSIDYRA